MSGGGGSKGGGSLLGALGGPGLTSALGGINSLTGSNLGNMGGWGSAMKTGFDSPAAMIGAPLGYPTNWVGMQSPYNPQSTIPSALGDIGGNSSQPQFSNPMSWAQRAPTGGTFNQMAQQLAGPVYTGGLQIPGVSPALANQPLGSKGAASPSGGSKGMNPISNPTNAGTVTGSGPRFMPQPQMVNRSGVGR